MTSDPTSGTKARHSQVCASAVGIGMRRAMAATTPWMNSSTGRDAATTMITKTKSGSVYDSDSA